MIFVVVLNSQLRKNLKSLFPNNFDISRFFGHKLHMVHIILSTSGQTAKILKTGFAKIGHTSVSKSQWVGFSSTKTDCDKFESWKNFFSTSLLGLFFNRTTQKLTTLENDCFPKDEVLFYSLHFLLCFFRVFSNELPFNFIIFAIRLPVTYRSKQ